MITKIIGRRAFRIALGTMAIVLLLQSVSYAGANPTQQNNNASSETGVTYSQKVPFSIESIAEVKERESRQPAHAQERRVIPFHRGPPLKEQKLGTAPLKPQSALQYELATSSLAPVLSSSFLGITSVGLSVPPDTMGTAGPSHLMEMTNENLGFFNKSTGALISSVSLQAFWSSLGTGSGQPDNRPFDPKVIYDQYSGRFIAVTMGGTSSPGSWLMIGVSATSDPTGTWSKWAIAADNDSGVHTFNNWADYPGFGVDSNYVYVTANMFSNNNNYQYSKVWVLPKTQLLSGNASITWTEFRNATGSGFTMQPAHMFGSSSAEYFVHENFTCPDPNFPCLAINNITFPGGTPTWNRMGDIVVNNYNFAFPDAPQLGTGTLIATNDRRLLNAIFRNGSLWTTHTVGNVSISKTEVAWYQINPANASLSLPFGTPAQQGRISDASRWYYFPSIAVNSNGDVGIGFSGSSASEFAGAYYTARNASDAPGTMQSVALLKAGLAPYAPFANRWGDYSATVVDPIDNTTFWTLQEYVNTSSLWGTWWGKFALITVIPSLSISATPTTVTVGTPTNVTFTVTSSGSAISGANVSLSGNATGGGTTDINGNATISVNATGAGTITTTASATGFTNGTTTITATTAASVLTNITVSPAAASLFIYNVTQTFTAAQKDQFNNTMTNITVTWSSSSTRVGTIASSGATTGLFTPLMKGNTTITAASGNISGTASVTVIPGNDTVGIYQNSTGAFFLRNSNSAGIADITMQYGPGGGDFLSLAGDWDGNGNATIGIYQKSTGIFFLRNSNNAGAADITVQYGPGGSDFLPLVGDWDGNGNATIGIYQKSTGTFFLRNSNSAGAADITVQYGPGGSDFLPVVGDWDGNGNATIGIYQKSAGIFFLRNSNSAGAADITVQFGPGGSDFLPVVGDWDGNGNATIGIYQKSTGTFFLRNSNSAGAADVTVQFGPGGSEFLPVVGNWDGQ